MYAVASKWTVETDSTSVPLQMGPGPLAETELLSKIIIIYRFTENVLPFH